MTAGRLAETLAALKKAGLEEIEVYAKRGRSRRLVAGDGVLGGSVGGRPPRLGPSAGYHREQGWAVRAGDRRGSFAAAGSGEPPPAGPWPAADGHPIRLPDPAPAPAWNEPSDFDAPLIGEREGLALLDSLERGLVAELPGARLLTAVLEDGSSESEVANARGVAASWRSRVAALRLEAVAPAAGSGGSGGAPASASLVAVEREARRFDVPALARRLADLLTVAPAAAPAERDRGEILVAPAVGARLLAGLVPLLVGPGATHRAAALRDRRGRVASAELTVVDDGRLPGGVLEAPCDGEGVATRADRADRRGRLPPAAPRLAPDARRRGRLRLQPPGELARPAAARSHPPPRPAAARPPRSPTCSAPSPAATICSTPPAPASSTSRPTASPCRSAASPSPPGGRWGRWAGSRSPAPSRPSSAASRRWGATSPSSPSTA